MKRKDINLLIALDRKPAAARGSALRLPVALLIVALLLICAVYYLLCTETEVLKMRGEDAQRYLADESTVAGYDESQRMRGEAESMAAQKRELEQVLLGLSSYPELSGGDFGIIYEYAGEQIQISKVVYDQKLGVLSFDAQADSVTGVPIFISQLRASQVFADIRYEGYTEETVEHPAVPATEAVQGTPEVPAVPPQPVYDQDGNLMFDRDGNPIVIPGTAAVPGTPGTPGKPGKAAWTEKHYRAAVTALVNAPSPHLPN